MKGNNDDRLNRLLKVLGPRKGPFSAHSVPVTPITPPSVDSTAAELSEVAQASSAPVSPTVGTTVSDKGLPGINRLAEASKPSDTAFTEKTSVPPVQKSLKSKNNVLAIINRGIDNYNKHRFHNAEDDFNEAVDMAPGLARTYAYLGVTLLQLNERASAMDAMQAAYELDPFGTFGRYAKNCLIILAGDEEIRRRGPRDDKKTVEQVLNKVNKQANSDAGRFSRTANVAANDRQNTSSRFTSRLAGEYSSSDGNSNEYNLRSAYARTDAAVQAANAQKDATLRSAYAKEAANNLKMLLTTKMLPGGSRLRAFGTTLNTRYYGTETRNLAPWYIPREYPPELRAQAKTIVKKSGKKASGKRVPTRSSAKLKSRSRTAPQPVSRR